MLQMEIFRTKRQDATQRFLPSHWASGRFSDIQEVAAERRHLTAEEKGSSSWTNLWTGTPTIKGEGPERRHTSRTIKDGNKLTAGVMSSGAGPLDSTPAVSGNQTSQLFISGDFTGGRGGPSIHCSHQNSELHLKYFIVLKYTSI